MARQTWIFGLLIALVVACGSAGLAQDEGVEPIDSSACVDCHEESVHGTLIAKDLENSSHAFLECLDCHEDKDTFPHREASDFAVGDDSCRMCHYEAGEVYTMHGRGKVGETPDVPTCADCHGDHDILSANVKRSRTHPSNLPATCGACHSDLNLTKKYQILIDHPIEVYQSSVHGQATAGGVPVAATCNDCHSTGGSAHRILGPGDPESRINHFNIPETCGQCHRGIADEYLEGIHGKFAARGETDAPVCTDCHGEHGILSPDDPRSPVSHARMAEQTCSPCHESAVLNEKYGLATGRLASFIDSYHGLKSKAGDPHVANCGSCHGVHRILPSSDPRSSVHPDNLQKTCGDCHPGISASLAAQPIHGVTGQGLRTEVADVVERIYIVVIVLTIGLMVIHWLIDLFRQLRAHLRSRPQVRRMRLNEVWQHALLALTFIALVISGFSLRFSDSWFARLFFGWEGGFEWRGNVHRIAAVLFTLTAAWHMIYVAATIRGRRFVRDMLPTMKDAAQMRDKMLYNLGRKAEAPRFGRFSYVEKAEYWALIWGTVLMTVTGVLLWFDNFFIQHMPKGVLDVALVIHYWEAWLATLAILVWHMYSTVFNPEVYPMNPSWITGNMPDEMYRHEHPEHYEQARAETDAEIREELARMSVPREETHDDDSGEPGEDAGETDENDRQVG
jgi:formate dehydrogenase gamma subunit